MKKYHQLVLLIISVVSLSLFLIYRHEYNRLHYVLEVFNFFGQPCNVSDLQLSENVLSHHDWGPLPVWQEYESGHVYSAFLTNKTEAKALAVGSDEKLVPRNCYFWTEDKKKPLVGKFKFSKVATDANVGLSLYFYSCSAAHSDATAYAVSFSYKAKRESELKKVLLANTFSHQAPTINATVCVSPTLFSKRKLIEFLSYHKLIGIDSFIFYNRDIPHGLSKIVTNLSTRLRLQASFLPWNFPKAETSLTRIIIENDCLLRTFGQSNYATTLEMNEYIVPANVYDFNTLIKSFNIHSERLGLPVQKFCVNNAESNQPIAMQNTEIFDDYNYNVVRYIYKNIVKKDIVSTYSVDKGLASIHKYIRCGVEPPKTYYDKTILRYNTDLVRSTLFQFLLHGQI